MQIKKVSVIMVAMFLFLSVPLVYAFTEEEQLVYDNLYLQLPWKPGVLMTLTQENQDTPTHVVGSFDEYALDFGLTTGVPVLAAASGVAYLYKDGNTLAPDYGNHIKIDHGHFYTMYAHLSSFAEGLSNGREVSAGEIIGYAGATGGKWNPHLHFGLFHGHAWEDGYRYSVKSKVIVANEGAGPYQSLGSTEFRNWQKYLSGNFKAGEQGMIVCNEDNACQALSSDGTGGYDPGDSGSASGPDANVKLVELSDDKTHWHHTIKAYPGQTLEARMVNTNKGDEIIDYHEAFFHRSPDLLFSQSSDFSYGREEETDDLLPGESTTKHRTITAPATPGTYYVFAYINRVDGKNGGIDQNKVNNLSRSDDLEEYAVLVVEMPPPWANFTAGPTQGIAPLSVQFIDKTVWSPTWWWWNFGDGQTSGAQHPVHTYYVPGVYTVSLTAGNAKGSTTWTIPNAVSVAAMPSIQITNPTASDNWRSSDVKDIKWNRYNFPSPGTVRIEYSLNDGASWRLITASSTNDGIKHWDMCDFYTTNTSYARVRIISNEYPGVQAISQRFKIDHARGCR